MGRADILSVNNAHLFPTLSVPIVYPSSVRENFCFLFTWLTCLVYSPTCLFPSCRSASGFPIVLILMYSNTDERKDDFIYSTFSSPHLFCSGHSHSTHISCLFFYYFCNVAGDAFWFSLFFWNTVNLKLRIFPEMRKHKNLSSDL